MIEAKVIEDSISESGKRITTLQVKFHRFILPEFLTHRVFSRNFSSSRAIPTKKLLEQVRYDPATPVHWGKNQPGMQAVEELTGNDFNKAKSAWVESAGSAANIAEYMAASGAHKQIVNRIIEPYLWVQGVVTSTEWDNWFELRAHEDAQPEIHALALEMKQAMDNSTPRGLKSGQWHLPYITEAERNDSFFTEIEANRNMLKKISAARCCRVSYLKHDGAAPNVNEDLELFMRLAGAAPLHASPLEHQATPDTYNQHIGWENPAGHGNFKGWIQHRKVWEKQFTANSVRIYSTQFK